MRDDGGAGPTGERGTGPTGSGPGRRAAREVRRAGDDPVFVLCAGRSGSTLLRFLLDAHPDLACPPETRLPWLARQLATAWAVIEDAGPSGQSANGSSADAAISAPVAEGLRRSLDPMMTSYLRRRGKRRYCDKSLGAAQHAGLLLRIWPGARFICLYRHPMDVIASGIEASPWGLTSYGFEPYIGSPPDNNVAALARYWLDYTTSIVAAEEHFTDRCLPVRYEDLVTDPDGEIARILEFIGAAPAPGIVARCFGPGHQRFGPGDYKIWNTSGVSADSVGRGWTMPAGKIPAPLLGRVNELADVLGYIRVGEQWGTGAKPADLRTRKDDPAPAAGGEAGGEPDRAPDREHSREPDRTPGRAPAALPDWAVAVDERVRAGLARVGEQFGAGPRLPREGIGPALRQRARLGRRGRLVAARPGGGHGRGGPGRGRGGRRLVAHRFGPGVGPAAGRPGQPGRRLPPGRPAVRGQGRRRGGVNGRRHQSRRPDRPAGPRPLGGGQVRPVS